MIYIYHTTRRTAEAVDLGKALKAQGHRVATRSLKHYTGDPTDATEVRILGHGVGVQRPEGYRVERVGMWWTLYGPDGSKVGKAMRREADAWAQVAD